MILHATYVYNTHLGGLEFSLHELQPGGSLWDKCNLQ